MLCTCLFLSPSHSGLYFSPSVVLFSDRFCLHGGTAATICSGLMESSPLAGRYLFPYCSSKNLRECSDTELGLWAKSQTKNTGQGYQGQKLATGVTWTKKRLMRCLLKRWSQRFRMTKFPKLNRISLERHLSLSCLMSPNNIRIRIHKHMLAVFHFIHSIQRWRSTLYQILF